MFSDRMYVVTVDDQCGDSFRGKRLTKYMCNETSNRGESHSGLLCQSRLYIVFNAVPPLLSGKRKTGQSVHVLFLPTS